MAEAIKAEAQEASEPLSWNIKFFGKEGFDEHIRVTAKDGETLSKLREETIKALVDAGATTGRVAAGLPKAAAPQGDPMAAAAAAAGVSKTCPTHNVAMETVPKVSKYNPVVVPGVSSHTNRAGKKYKAFWACPVEGCEER